MPQSFPPLRNFKRAIADVALVNQTAQLEQIVPELLQSIEPILLANRQSGRMARAMVAGRYATPGDYTRAVAGYYQAWQPTLFCLLSEGDEALWTELFARLQCLSRRYLRHAAPHLIDGLEDAATACAEETAIVIMQSRYPFDCDFLAWTYATLRTICRRRLYQQCNATDLFSYCIIQHDVSELGAEQIDVCDDWLDELLMDVSEATSRLATTNRRQFARLRYYEGKDYEQIAVEMGKSINALYKLNSDILANYRQLLSETGNRSRRRTSTIPSRS